MREELESLVERLNREGMLEIKGQFVFAKAPPAAEGERGLKYPILQLSYEGKLELLNLNKGRYRIDGNNERRIFRFLFRGEGKWYRGEDLDGKACVKIDCPQEGQKAEARIYLESSE